LCKACHLSALFWMTFLRPLVPPVSSRTKRNLLTHGRFQESLPFYALSIPVIRGPYLDSRPETVFFPAHPLQCRSKFVPVFAFSCSDQFPLPFFLAQTFSRSNFGGITHPFIRFRHKRHSQRVTPHTKRSSLLFFLPKRKVRGRRPLYDVWF